MTKLRARTLLKIYFTIIRISTAGVNSEPYVDAIVTSGLQLDNSIDRRYISMQISKGGCAIRVAPG